MSNLLEETIDVLKRRNHTTDDILAVQGTSHRISIEKFIEIAKKTNYDPGFGSQKIASDLILLMKDGSMYTRGEYDGSEWWQYICIPKPLDHIDDDVINKLDDDYWSDLAECNGISNHNVNEEDEEEPMEDEEEPMEDDNSLTNGAWDELNKLDLK